MIKTAYTIWKGWIDNSEDARIIDDAFPSNKKEAFKIAEEYQASLNEGECIYVRKHKIVDGFPGSECLQYEFPYETDKLN